MRKPNFTFHRVFGVVANDKPEAQKAMHDVISFLEGEVDDIRAFSSDSKYSSTIGNIVNSDVLIVFGGDGTVLEWARYIAKYAKRKDVPMITVNFGTLGFITEIEAKNIKKMLFALAENRYTKSERIMLRCIIANKNNPEDKKEYFALNDVAVVKARHARMLVLNTSINGKEIAQQHSDGLIVSTPTGSTGYNLSAGGAILHPDMQAIQITPICPHTLNSRPVVIPAEKAKVNIDIVPRSDRTVEVQVVVDGQECAFFNDNEYSVEVERYEYNIIMYGMENGSFYNKLCKRLEWGKGIV